MGLYSGALIIRRIFASEISGAYFREGLLFLGGGGLLSEFYGMLPAAFSLGPGSFAARFTRRFIRPIPHLGGSLGSSREQGNMARKVPGTKSK